MTITELQELIADMPLTDEDRKEIMLRQEQGASAGDILNLVADKLDDVEREIMQATPEGAAVYKEAMDDFVKEVAAANTQFEEAMRKIEEDAEAFNKAINKELDAARMQELTEERSNIAA